RALRMEGVSKSTCSVFCFYRSVQYKILSSHGMSPRRGTFFSLLPFSVCIRPPRTTVVPSRTRTRVEACLVSRSGAVAPEAPFPPPPPLLASVTTDFKLVSTGEMSKEIQSSPETWGVRERMEPIVIELTTVCCRIVDVHAVVQ